MKRIFADFNTLNISPIGLVKLGKVGTPNGDRLPALSEGERVQLWELGLEVEATVELRSGDYWMARPDDATWRDLPLPSEEAVEASQP